VAVVAPASPFKREEFESGVAELESLGFHAAYDERVFARDGYVAGAAAERARALDEAWADPAIRAIFTVRGGYGSAQVLPFLDGRRIRDARKIFVGYSDITSLLCLHLLNDLVCFHGPMLERRLSRGEAGYDRRTLLETLTNPAPLGELRPDSLQTLHAGDARGMLVGGTLTQLVSLLGTPWAFMPPRGSILFLEDIGERPYRIDRMLTQLRQARMLEGVAALVFGTFPDCDEPRGGYRVEDVLASLTADLGIPVLFGFPSGHTRGPTWTLPFGVRAQVAAGPEPSLVIEEAAVE
jgi:muramoyltetrapeptide carboxypeptidase